MSESVAEGVLVFSGIVAFFIATGLGILMTWAVGADEAGWGVGLLTFPIVWIIGIWINIVLLKKSG